MIKKVKRKSKHTHEVGKKFANHIFEKGRVSRIKSSGDSITEINIPNSLNK
jgi:hypothetical protein